MNRRKEELELERRIRSGRPFAMQTAPGAAASSEASLQERVVQPSASPISTEHTEECNPEIDPDADLHL